MANKPAKQLVFTGKSGRNNLKTLQTWTFKGDKAYVITYTANLDDYNEFIQTAEKMIKSLEIN
ncbi:MAG: hypothetical protein KME38_23480 [Spirirestis rafaelensis WJT71-NPBG6]|nr:hypothetical protein [Spirirestis rafaelensis WJT71-NPBG6]